MFNDSSPARFLQNIIKYRTNFLIDSNTKIKLMWTLVSRRRLIKRKTGLWHPVRIGCSGILWRTWERPFALGAENGSPLFIQKMEPRMAQWTSLALGPGRGGGAALSNPFEKGFKNSRLRLQVLRNTQNQTVRHGIRMVLSLSGRRPDSDQAAETSSPASALKPLTCFFLKLSCSRPTPEQNPLRSLRCKKRRSKLSHFYLRQVRRRVLNKVSVG